MTFEDAIDRMSERKSAALGTQSSRIVPNDVTRLLCAGTGADYDDVEVVVKLLTANFVQALLDGVPLIPLVEGYFLDALMTGHLAGSADE